jgi:hypothetical protein
MKAYKVELLIVDFDELGPDDVRETIENQRYPNDCISPNVKSIEVRDIGEWHDDHPLNDSRTADAEYQRLFGVDSGRVRDASAKADSADSQKGFADQPEQSK